MREILFVVVCVVAGAVVASVVMLATLPYATTHDHMETNYHHEVETMMCFFGTIPLGGWLGGLTGYAAYVRRDDPRGAAHVCIVQGLWVAVPLIAWGVISLKLQLETPPAAIAQWGPPHWIGDFLSQCGLSTVWSVAVVGWGVATKRKLQRGPVGNVAPQAGA